MRGQCIGSGICGRIIDAFKRCGQVEVFFDCKHQHPVTIINLSLESESADERLPFVLCHKLIILLMAGNFWDWSAPH
jgi:hypothetical protein